MSPTAAFTWLVFPIAWRWPGRNARMLFEFALAEQATTLDLQAAAARTESTQRRALYVRHAIDERRHAALFAAQSAERRALRALPPVGRLREADTEDLFERLGELGFLAFVHLGERRACQKFAVIHAFLTRREPGVLAGALGGILRDEERHARYTWELLVALAGGEGGARWAVRRAALRYAWRRWRRWGDAVARALHAGLMMLLYALVAPLALLVRVVRPVRAGWHPPS
jgi:hypothetical protein